MALAFRGVVMFLYWPALMLWFDSPRFARVDRMPMFGDFWMPAGYPMLLKSIQVVSDALWVTIAVQHLIGIGTGVLSYFAVKRLTSHRAVASLAASVPLFSGDHIYLEHTILADFLLTFFAAAGLYAAVLALTGRHWRLTWLATASVLFMAAAITRSVGVVLIPILTLFAVCLDKDSWRERIKAGAAALLPGMAVLGVYIAASAMTGGQYLGLYDMRGWNLYSRVAPFADCRRFAPPQGTSVLCEDVPPPKRSGPYYYSWQLESISRRNFEQGPQSGRVLGAFAAAVILHQPGDYARSVMIDLARHISPAIQSGRPFSGQPREILSFGWHDDAVQEIVVSELARSYEGAEVRMHPRARSILGWYQNVVRVHGFALLGLILLTVAGMVLGSGNLRRGICLYGFCAAGLYVVPVLTLSYDFRYGIPPQTFLVVSGVIGGFALLRAKAPRFRDWRGGGGNRTRE